MSAEPRTLWMFICPYCGVWQNQSIKVDGAEVKEGRYTNWRGAHFKPEVREEKRKNLEKKYRGRTGSKICDMCYESRMELADSGVRR